MNAESIADILAENKAQLSNLAEHQGLGQDVLIRFWTVGQEDLDGCLTYLKAQTTILNPMTGTRWARTGLWYAGDVDYKPGNANPLVVSGANGLIWLVFQTISKGDKVITITEDCAAYTKTRVIHTFNPDIPSGVAGAGTIVNVDATPTELGRERTVQETILPKDQTATSGTETGMRSVVRVSHTENPSAPMVPAAITPGVIKRVDAQPTTAGNVKSEEETDTAKAVSVPEYVARMGERVTEYRSEEYHAAEAPDVLKFKDSGGIERTIALDAQGNPTYGGANMEVAVLAHELDDYLLHNYKKSRQVRNFPITDAENVLGISWDIFGETEAVTSQVYSATLGRYWNDHTYIYQLKRHYTVRYFRTAAEAAAWITTVYVSVGTQENNQGSTYHHSAEFEYEAVRVVNTKILRTTYDYLEPAS
ncbi:MAG: hypothetical protein WC130_04400 [Kiritimatiellia bacterium]